MTAITDSGILRSHPRFLPTRTGISTRGTSASASPSQATLRGPHSCEKRPVKLLDQVREAIRVRHYSLRTEEAYVRWVKRFIFFHGK
jgi:hypothetical protein